MNFLVIIYILRINYTYLVNSRVQIALKATQKVKLMLLVEEEIQDLDESNRMSNTRDNKNFHGYFFHNLSSQQVVIGATTVVTNKT